MSDVTRPDAVEVLRRWQDCGASWRVLSEVDGTVTVAMLRCDGGEEVERLVSAEPELIAFLDGRETSED